MIRVVIVDDHAMFCRGLELIFNAGKYVRVVCATQEAREAAGICELADPDIALVDLSMPDPGGLSAMSSIKEVCPQVTIVALSGTERIGDMTAALRAGATSFLPKSGSAEKLVGPLRVIADGWTIVPRPVLAALIVDELVEPDPILKEMTPDEVEVWQMVAHGWTDDQIAEHRACSDRTAKRLIHKLLKVHLGGASRVQAAARGGKIGLLDIPLALPLKRLN